MDFFHKNARLANRDSRFFLAKEVKSQSRSARTVVIETKAVGLPKNRTLTLPKLQKLGRKLEQPSGGLISVNLESDLPRQSQPPMETDDPYDVLHFPCCQETLKLKRRQKHFCIICGTEVDMTISDAKRVFLSHKGANKKLVNDFKGTLELIGYKPWLDEDDMPAGTRVERGLQQGMKDSCGVVFFITPEFRDEGFLATEIDYAMMEKRRKGNKFAIVTLQFVGDDGSDPPIPELLQPFIWKTPKTDLEALREIVRALPVVPGAVDWTDDISGVTTLPKTITTYTELSVEAKHILREAVKGKRGIMYIRTMGGESLQVNGQNLIPNSDARTVAMWVAGLEDLQRLRYIKSTGSRGEIFEVTREGYLAADELELTGSI